MHLSNAMLSGVNKALVTRSKRQSFSKPFAALSEMYSDRRVFSLLQEIGVAEANGEVRFLTGSS